MATGRSPRDGTTALVIGLLVLEFATASTVYLTTVLLPAVVTDLQAADRYPLVVAPSGLGLFLSLPIADRLVYRLGPSRTLATALAVTVVGTVVAAVARDPWIYALGRLAAGFSGGVLAVFGIGAALDRLDDRRRTRVLAWLSAMWVAPALVVPPLAVLAEQAIGWRWTSLLLLPLVLIARILIGRAATRRSAEPPPKASLRWVLVPGGMVLVLVSNGASWGLVGLPLALVGAAALLPAGTFRARPGQARELAAFGLLVMAFFGADTLLTLAANRGLGLAAGPTGWVLAATGVAWGVSGQLQPVLVGRDHRRDPMVCRIGAGLLVAGLTWFTLQLGRVAPVGFLPALAAAAAIGLGMGLGYPTLFFRATTLRPNGPTAVQTAAAVVLVEALAAALVATAAGATVAMAIRLGAGERAGQQWVFSGCAAVALLLFPLLPRRDPERIQPAPPRP